MTARRATLAVLLLAAAGALAATAQDGGLFTKDEGAARASIAGGHFVARVVKGRLPDAEKKPVTARLDLETDPTGALIKHFELKGVGSVEWGNLKLAWQPAWQDPRAPSPQDPTAGAKYENVLLAEKKIETKVGKEPAQGQLYFIWRGAQTATIYMHHPTVGDYKGEINLERQKP